ncbi:hypothetical protein ACQB60_36035 [Actinomycetota bacterium Odt1-20B]
MGRALPEWDVPFAREVFGREPLAVLMGVETGMTDRARALEVIEEQRDAIPDSGYVLALAQLLSGMPFTALAGLEELADERPEHVPLRVDLATALVHAGRLAAAGAVLDEAAGLLERQGTGLARRWLDEVRRRAEWVADTLEQRALEREFLVLRIAAWDVNTGQERPTETSLLHAQSLCALGELDDSPEPFWTASRVVTETLQQQVSVRALELLVRIARSGLPASVQHDAMDFLRREHPESAVLRAARSAPLAGRELREREARAERDFLYEELVTAADENDQEALNRAFARLRRRAMSAEHRSPYLALHLFFEVASAPPETAALLSDEVAREPGMEATDLLRIAGAFARAGRWQEARAHARRCAALTHDPEEAARAAALLEDDDDAAV